MKSEQMIYRRTREAVCHFWATRQGQSERQVSSGRGDQGSRSEVTGGKQMDGFVHLVRDLITDCGLKEASIHTNSMLEVPGFFRPEKKWDLLVVQGKCLVAAIEFKSQIGPSFGNNFNNRTEEAIGTAQDIWTAYREGAFPMTIRPWLGYLMLLEDTFRSTTSVSVKQPHFPVFPEFVGASYAQRYQSLMTKLVRERLYDSACFLMSKRPVNSKPQFTIPDPALSIMGFALSLNNRIQAYLNTGQ